jgi:hypothetical protein
VSFTFAMHRTFIRNVAFLAMLALFFSGLRLSESVDAQSPGAGQQRAFRSLKPMLPGISPVCARR